MRLRRLPHPLLPQQNTKDWAIVNKGKTPVASERLALARDLRMEQRRFVFVRDSGFGAAKCQAVTPTGSNHRRRYSYAVSALTHDRSILLGRTRQAP